MVKWQELWTCKMCKIKCHHRH